MNDLPNNLLRVRIPVLSAWILTTLFASAVFVAGFAIDNSVGVWFPRDDPALAEYERHLEDFGESEWTLLLLETASVDSPRFRTELEALTGQLAALPHVGRVVSGANAPAAFAEQFLRRRNDDRHTVVLLSTDNFIERQDPYRIALVDGIHSTVERCPTVIDHSLAGTSVINAELNRSARRDMFVFFSLVTLLIFSVSFVLFRSVRDALILLAVALSTVVTTLGLIILCGYRLNMVTIMLPTVLIALSVADAIHVIHTFHRIRRAEGVDAAVRGVGRRLWLPCLGTSITTIVGFLSLSGSSVLPIFQLAVFSSFGIALAFFVAIFVAPLLLHLAWSRVSRAATTGSAHEPRTLSWLTGLIRHRPAAIVLGFVIACTGLLGLGRLVADTNYVEFFRSGSTVPAAYEKIDRAGFPQNPFTVVLRAPDRLSPERWTALTRLGRGLVELPEVKGVLSPRPDSDPLGLVSPDGRSVQVILMTDFLSSRGLHDLADRVRRLTRETVPADTKLVITGTTSLWASMDTRVIETQTRSILIVSVAIVFILAAIFRSVPVAVLGWFVSVLPVAVILGVMGILQVRINMATVLIAGIALGIAVDDTIHLVFCYREEIRLGTDSRRAVDRALRRVGPQLILTSLILIGGFASMVASDFLPTANFGLFTCLTIFAALLADLTVLPLALRWVGSGRSSPRHEPAPVSLSQRSEA